MQVEDFFPSYIEIKDKSLISDIAHRHEFSTLKLGPSEPVPKVGTGKLLLTQKIINRIMSPYTPYYGLLLDHGMGTGKTCNAVAVAETWIAFQERISQLLMTGVKTVVSSTPKRKVFLLVKSQNILNNFVDELANVCTDGKYLPHQEIMKPTMTELTQKIRTKKLYSENYEIATFETFSREVQLNIGKPEFVEKYSNRLIIIDEVHNLHSTNKNTDIYSIFDDITREYGLNANRLSSVSGASERKIKKYLSGGILAPSYKDIQVKIQENIDIQLEDRLNLKEIITTYVHDTHKELGKFKNNVIEELISVIQSNTVPHDDLNMYGRIYKFLHTIRDPRILLLTGTPMVDDASEIIDVLNLILPADEQLDNESNLRDIGKKARGRVSFLEQMVTDVPRRDMGDIKGFTKHIKLVHLPIDKFQEEAYLRAEKIDKASKNTGKKDTIKPSDIRKKAITVAWQTSRQAINFVFPDGSYGKAGANKWLKDPTFKEKVKKNLSKYSAKLDFIVKDMMAHPDECGFIFSYDVEGGGINTISKVFESFGWKSAKGGERGSGLRFAVITSKTPKEITRRIKKTFNSDQNWDGSIIRLIIGSEAVSEAFSFKHITRTYLFTPMWNNSKTEQAIFRTIRVSSHNYLKMKRLEMGDERLIEIKVFRLASISPQGRETIDTYMYKTSEEKDIDIMKYQRVLKENSIDCELTKGRNLLDIDEDGSRKCNYQTCQYECNTSHVSGEIYETFNIYYSSELQKQIYDYIMDTLLKNYSVSLLELHRLFKNYRNIVNLTVSQILTRYTSLKDNDGFEYKLNLLGDQLILLPMKDNVDADASGKFYSYDPIIHIGISMDKLIEYQTNRKDSSLLRAFRTTYNFDNLRDLSDETKRLLIKKIMINLSTLMKKMKTKKASKIVDTLKAKNKNRCMTSVIDYFVGKDVMDLDEMSFSIGDKQIYVTDKGIEDVKKIAAAKVKRAAKASINIPKRLQGKELCGYLSKIKDIEKLFIIDFKSTKVGRGDGRGPSGMVCSSKKSLELVMILWRLGAKGIKIDENVSKKILAERIETAGGVGFSGRPLTKIIDDRAVYEDYTKDQLKFILSFAHKKKSTLKTTGDPSLCDLIYKELKKSKLIITEDELYVE